MATTRLCRLSGLALIFCGPLALVGHILNIAAGGKDVAGVGSALWIPAHLLVLLSYALALLGLPGLYARLAPRLGVVGLVGYLAFILRLTTSIGSMTYEIAIIPILAREPTVRALVADGALNTLYGGWGFPLAVVLNLGIAALGIQIARAPARGRWAGLVVVLGSVVAFAIPPLGYIIREGGLAWLGSVLLSEQRESRATPSPADAMGGSAAARSAPVANSPVA